MTKRNDSDGTRKSKGKDTPEWQRKAAQVKEAAGWRCEDCGTKEKPLDAHHTAYIHGRDYHDYPNELLMSLCRECHEKRQNLENGFRVHWGRLTRLLPPDMLESEFWRMHQEATGRWTEHYSKGFEA